jgi:hypothetical protein
MVDVVLEQHSIMGLLYTSNSLCWMFVANYSTEFNLDKSEADLRHVCIPVITSAVIYTLVSNEVKIGNFSPFSPTNFPVTHKIIRKEAFHASLCNIIVQLLFVDCCWSST